METATRQRKPNRVELSRSEFQTVINTPPPDRNAIRREADIVRENIIKEREKRVK